MAKSPINFNIYEVLEPLKCCPNTPKDKNVGILIDISDDSGLSQDLSGSDLDSIKKSEFDLVDLFQNIYVTPSLVKKPKDTTVDIDYKDRKDKKIDSTYQNGLKPLKEEDINELLNKFDKNETDLKKSNDTMFHDYSLYKYDIPKVLEVPTFYDLDEIDENKCTSVFEKNITEKFSEITTDFHNDVFVKATTDTVANKRLESAVIQTNCPNNNNTSVTDSKDHTDILKKVVMEFKKNTELSLQNHTTFQSIVSPTLTLKLPKIENFDLQTAKLDKKLYTKQLLQRTQKDKVLYTKGPDLYEKSVVLPLIMKRLASRKDEVQLTRRLILDSGKSKIALNSKDITSRETLNSKSKIVNKDFRTITEQKTANLSPDAVKLNPIVAMEDCNKERLLAHRTRSAFERFVHTGSYF
ncbi:uncharacterized protein [Epargyreus clarus]|uniref:uncharacterized protein n=1 Tax=Epargyreus clarus TaxID=520877 RepID=UPI003C2EF4F7